MFQRFLMSAMCLTLCVAAAFARKSAPREIVSSIAPPCWWTAMACDTLQLMVAGPGVGAADVSVEYPGVRLAERVSLDNPDWLLLYLVISDDARPGDVGLTFTLGMRRQTLAYPLKERDASMRPRAFTAADVMYLIMPDRFARKAPADAAAECAGLDYPTVADRSRPHARHGGNIAGMRSRLDYLDSLGVTAIWVNPVLENDQPGGSYHGYSTTDYYRIDPRFGSNDEWREFVADAHAKGMKVVMDMIFNHCGSNHPWLKSLPSPDWLNRAGDEYQQTNYRLTTLHDPYASDFDRLQTTDGWFVRSMPDLNQRNPHVLKYLIQNSIWWIEYSGIDGIRMDTHPYCDAAAMARWLADVDRQYPGYNIVGECWYENEASSAYWQKNSLVNRDLNPQLPSVMDFVLMQKGRDAFSQPTRDGKGLEIIYNHLTLDFLFPDPSRILTFFDNHDTDRFLLEAPENLNSWKQAMTFLLTSRGIPQIYYGTEILMHGTKARGDGNIRLDMPGGFEGDSTTVFTRQGRTPMQNEAFDFLSKLLRWRRGNDVIARGSLRHFIPAEGVYVYQRALDGRTVTVMLNGTDAPVNLPTERYAEILPRQSKHKDMLTGREITIEHTVDLPARGILVLECM